MVTQWKCVPCGKTFKTIETLDEHKKTKKHKQSAKTYSQGSETAANSESMFKSVQYESDKSDILSDLQKSLAQSQG